PSLSSPLPHSSLTRRSSDLGHARLFRVCCFREVCLAHPVSLICLCGRFSRPGQQAIAPLARTLAPPLTGAFAGAVISKNHRWRRSEEHTSELQSRENLVCRL